MHRVCVERYVSLDLKMTLATHRETVLEIKLYCFPGFLKSGAGGDVRALTARQDGAVSS